jgi:hypothetical protein
MVLKNTFLRELSVRVLMYFPIFGDKAIKKDYAVI